MPSIRRWAGSSCGVHGGRRDSSSRAFIHGASRLGSLAGIQRLLNLGFINRIIRRSRMKYFGP